jgi:hypothetical protein
MNELIFLPAVVMAERIRRRKISPVELVEAHLAQIEKLNPRLNAFVHVDAERARRAGRNAETAVIQEKSSPHCMVFPSASKVQSAWRACVASRARGCGPDIELLKTRRW